MAGAPVIGMHYSPIAAITQEEGWSNAVPTRKALEIRGLNRAIGWRAVCTVNAAGTVSTMRLDDTPPEPYRIRFSATAQKQAVALQTGARARLNGRLLQLADLASFAAGYSLPVSEVARLIADLDGLSIKYEIDDRARTLTLLEIEKSDESPGHHPHFP